MIGSLMLDPEVPRKVKVVLAAVAVYLVSPVDLVPDWIPFLGYLDDVLLVAVVVDGLLNFLDRSILLRYWPRHPTLDATAAVVRRLARWVPAGLKARIFSGR